MTLSVTTKSTRYTGTGANTALSTVFTFFQDSEVEVWKRITATGVESLLSNGSEYTMTGGGASGAQAASVGTVTPTDGATDFPTTVTWEIRRVMPLTQADYDAAEGDSFAALSVEGAFDRAAMNVQHTNQWVLLDQASGAAQSSLTVTSNGWSDLYDSVRLELFAITPGTAGEDLLVKVVDNGSVVVTGLNSVSRTHVASGTDTTNEVIAGAIQTDPVHGLAGAVNQSLFGELTCYYAGGYLNGRCDFTYTDSVETAPARCVTSFARTAAATRIDGFEVSMSTGTLTGKIRLWGMPRY